MKIIIVGATGTIGKKVTELLTANHEVITVGRTRGQYQVDVTDPQAIRGLFEKIGKFDALISATGDIAFAPLKDLKPEHWEVGIRSKLLGQVNLVQIGKEYINEGGSFTLTSGILTTTFIAAGTSATSINRAVEGFAQAAAAEIGHGIRINVVSPDMLEDSKAAYGAFFPGHAGVSGEKVANAYIKSALGIETGKIYKAVSNDY